MKQSSDSLAPQEGRISKNYQFHSMLWLSLATLIFTEEYYIWSVIFHYLEKSFRY